MMRYIPKTMNEIFA